MLYDTIGEHGRMMDTTNPILKKKLKRE